MKCYVTGCVNSVMCCNVLGEATVTRISTLSGRGGGERGDWKTCKMFQLNKYYCKYYKYYCDAI